MKKFVILISLILLTFSAFAAYNPGDVVANYYWTDNTGADHDIYELTALGTAIVFFWGGTG
jgi:hypothetical protein